MPLVFRQGYRLLNQKTRRKIRAGRRGQSLKARKTPGYR
jgi:hypothetical protein